MLSLVPPYIIQIQKPHFCAVACLNMILYRQLWIIFEQEKLGLFFNISVEPSTLYCFENTFKTTTDINGNEWFVTIESENIVNNFFDSKNLPLKAEAFHLTKILTTYPSLHSFISKNIKENNDLWIEYKVWAVWEWYTGMHDGLIESIDWNNITIINPQWDNKNRESIPLILLEDALSSRIARETGIVVIKKI